MTVHICPIKDIACGESSNKCANCPERPAMTEPLQTADAQAWIELCRYADKNDLDWSELSRMVNAILAMKGAQQAPALQPEPQTTGWPPSELMQDDHSGLSKALSNTPHARLNAREAAAAIPPPVPLLSDALTILAKLRTATMPGSIVAGWHDELEAAIRQAAVIAKQAASPESKP